MRAIDLIPVANVELKSGEVQFDPRLNASLLAFVCAPSADLTIKVAFVRTSAMEGAAVIAAGRFSSCRLRG